MSDAEGARVSASPLDKQDINLKQDELTNILIVGLVIAVCCLFTIQFTELRMRRRIWKYG